MFAGLERRCPGLFVTAGAMMFVAGAFFGVAQVASGAYVLFLVAALLGILAATAGCVGTRGLGAGAARSGGVLTVVGGVTLAAGALAVVINPVAFVLVEIVGREPAALWSLFVVVFLVTFLGFATVLLTAGVSAWRGDDVPAEVGPLLVGAALLLAFPAADVIFEVVSPPAWMPVVALAIWGAIFLRVGAVLRAGQRDRREVDPGEISV